MFGTKGIFLGPLIGGSLATPATQYPRVFGRFQFLHDYPYALSTIVVGALGLISAVITALFVKEVRPSFSASLHPCLSNLSLLDPQHQSHNHHQTRPPHHHANPQISRRHYRPLHLLRKYPHRLHIRAH
jgi:hypothetical protein